MATTVARLEAILSADTKGFDRSMKASESRMEKVGRAAKVGLAIGVGAGIAVLKSSVNAAIDAEKSQRRLEAAFKASGVNINRHTAAIEKASDAAINLGFDDEDLKDSLGSLIIATGNYNKAQDAANVAMDLARFKGISLEQATKSLTMAMAGSQRATKQLGLDIPKVTVETDKAKRAYEDQKDAINAHFDALGKLTPALKAQRDSQLENAKANYENVKAAAAVIDKQKTAATVIETVKRKVDGQSEAYRKTAEGSMAVFSMKLEELQEKLGAKLLPKLTQVVTGLSRFVDKLEDVDKWMAKIGANQGLLDILDKIKAKTEGLKGPSGLDVVRAMHHAWQAVALSIERAVRAVGSFLDKLGKLKGPSGIDIVKGIGGAIGDVSGRIQNAPVGGTGPASISPALYDELAGARSFGLTLTSGYRPGAVTKHGTPSDHGVYPSKAIDVAGSPNRMAAFFRWLVGQSDVKQAFYDPLGSIFGGVRSSYREGGHSDHVHVATYDRGGWLRPGWNLAYNGLGRPERVGGGDNHFYFPNYVGSKTELMSFMQNAARKWRRQNGKGAF